MTKNEVIYAERREKEMKLWKQRQTEKGYLTWQEYMEAVEEDKTQNEEDKTQNKEEEKIK